MVEKNIGTSLIVTNSDATKSDGNLVANTTCTKCQGRIPRRGFRIFEGPNLAAFDN